MSRGQKLYCAFVDYKKAFDTVWRNGLWNKLINSNVNSRILTVIQNLYKSAKSCVEVNGDRSPLFACSIGVRQGENLSPFLFNIFLNDLSDFMQSEGFEGLRNLDMLSNTRFYRELGLHVKMFLLLYADDTIIVADDQKGLQKGLNCLEQYCNVWKLSVNISKTKVLIFSRGKCRNNINFIFKNEPVEIVTEYTYLGIVLNYNGKFSVAIKRRHDQASKAMFAIIGQCRKLDLPCDTALELFDRIVVPIMLYGCEVWGFGNIDILERLQLKFCKILLKLGKRTPSCMIYNELGRYPIAISIKSRMLSYWAKLTVCKVTKWCSILYQIIYGLVTEGYISSDWCNFVKDILDKTGNSFLWLQQRQIDPKWLKDNVNQILKDQFKQSLNEMIYENPKCLTYRCFANEHSYKGYLNELCPSKSLAIMNFRMGNTKLPAVKGRLFDLDVDRWKCNLCDMNDIGDELHYVLKCPHFSRYRRKNLPSVVYSTVNTLNFSRAMNPTNLTELSQLASLCKVIIDAFKNGHI